MDDHSLLAHELQHSIKHNKKKHGLLSLKIDLEKAYDFIDWDFRQLWLTKMGYKGLWFDMAMACATSTLSHINVNGHCISFCKPSRDPAKPLKNLRIKDFTNFS